LADDHFIRKAGLCQHFHIRHAHWFHCRRTRRWRRRLRSGRWSCVNHRRSYRWWRRRGVLVAWWLVLNSLAGGTPTLLCVVKVVRCSCWLLPITPQRLVRLGLLSWW
jgi:hypothetical protein